MYPMSDSCRYCDTGTSERMTAFADGKRTQTDPVRKKEQKKGYAQSGAGQKYLQVIHHRQRLIVIAFRQKAVWEWAEL